MPNPETNTPIVADEEISLDKALEESLKEADTGGSGEGALSLESDVDAGGDDNSPEDLNTAERARDESGRFVPQEAQNKEASQPQKDSRTQTPAAGTAPQGEPDAAPASLSAEMKAQWQTLPPTVKAEFTRLTKDSSASVQKVQREFTDYKRDREAIDPVLQPFEKLCKEKGLYVPTTLKSYIDWSYLAETNPQKFLELYTQRMGLNLEQVVMKGTPQQLDPAIQAAIQAEVAPIKTQFTQAQQAQASAQQEQANRALTTFSTAVDEKGAVLRPHFDRVLPVMATLWGEVQRRNPGLSTEQHLQMAYESACRADPEIHRLILQDEFAKRETTAKQEAAQRANQARNAMVSPSSATPVNASARAEESIADILSDVMANGNRI